MHHSYEVAPVPGSCYLHTVSRLRWSDFLSKGQQLEAFRSYVFLFGQCFSASFSHILTFKRDIPQHIAHLLRGSMGKTNLSLISPCFIEWLLKTLGMEGRYS